MTIFPINYNAKRIALVREVMKSTGITCITAEPETQNSPRPAKPYFTLKFINPGVKSGDDSASQVLDEDGNVTNIWNRGGQRKLSVDFNCYGRSHEEAYEYMGLWQASLELETVQARLRQDGIAVWLNGNVNDLSALLNTAFEGRAQMDVDFGIVSNLTEDLGEIDTVNISGTVTTDQNETENVTIQIIAPS